MPAHVPYERSETVENYFVSRVVPVHDTTGSMEGVLFYAGNVTEEAGEESAAGG